MHRRRTLLLIALIVLPLLATAAKKADAAPPEVTAAAVLERLAGLAGRWQGHSEEDGDYTFEYKVTGGGSTVFETMFPGEAREMTTVYHLDGDDLVATHYCAGATQPRFRLDRVRSTVDHLALRFDGGTSLGNGRSHVHDIRMTFVDAAHITSERQAGTPDGKHHHTKRFELTRR